MAVNLSSVLCKVYFWVTALNKPLLPDVCAGLSPSKLAHNVSFSMLSKATSEKVIMYSLSVFYSAQFEYPQSCIVNKKYFVNLLLFSDVSAKIDYHFWIQGQYIEHLGKIVLKFT